MNTGIYKSRPTASLSTRIIIPIALTPTGASPSTTSSTTTATQSICPKGWTLPSEDQSRSIGNDTKTYTSDFSPVLGGDYLNGGLYDEPLRGFWWTSTAYNGAQRYYLRYDGSSLYTGGDSRRANGFYVRCIQAS